MLSAAGGRGMLRTIWAGEGTETELGLWTICVIPRRISGIGDSRCDAITKSAGVSNKSAQRELDGLLIVRIGLVQPSELNQAIDSRNVGFNRPLDKRIPLPATTRTLAQGCNSHRAPRSCSWYAICRSCHSSR